MFVFEQVGPHPPRYLINFPTKRHWREPSRIENIGSGLQALVQVIQEHAIRSIAIPPLGCGLGGLDWQAVKPLIVAAPATLADVRVLTYEPHVAPHPHKRLKEVAARQGHN